jgi:hypothetical protein
MVKRRKTQKRRKTGLASLPGERQDHAWETRQYDIAVHGPNIAPGKLLGPPPADWRPPRIPRASWRPTRSGGGPLLDPDDRREARYGLRLHADLLAEVAKLARARGWKTSQLIEKTLIDLVNAGRKKPVVDGIGRHIED